MTMFKTDSILPPPPELPAPPEGVEPIVHNREYRVQAYRMGPSRLRIDGAVRDQKPPGLYVEDDDQALTVHHMQLSIEVELPSLEIVSAWTHMETHPGETCPSIIGHYDNLVGLSIARGFTHKVRDLFGGPKGCTHTTALLQAMAPVAIQSLWSMRIANDMAEGRPNPMIDRGARRSDDDSWKTNLNTCHVWAEDGETVANIKAGTRTTEYPLFIKKRLVELGRLEETS